MDSLTQLVTGAAVDEAIPDKNTGNKAIYIGAAAGTLSDLDVFPGMFMEIPDRLLFHRGFSHSVVFVILATVFFTWVFSVYFKKFNVSKR
ncbi:MAG TPA: metal-dependent hydrolase [Bacteroidales bacterium]|nr:metal-dependent hydrolase [Bacteroidales bacterium]